MRLLSHSLVRFLFVVFAQSESCFRLKVYMNIYAHTHIYIQYAYTVAIYLYQLHGGLWLHVNAVGIYLDEYII